VVYISLCEIFGGFDVVRVPGMIVRSATIWKLDPTSQASRIKAFIPHHWDLTIKMADVMIKLVIRYTV